MHIVLYYVSLYIRLRIIYIKGKNLNILSICLLLALLAPVSAAEVGYVGYKLPRLKGNNYTGYHQKATNDDYIRNIVENVSNTSTVNFWAQEKYCRECK